MPDRTDLAIRGIPLKLKTEFHTRCLHLGVSMTKRIVKLMEEDLKRPLRDDEELIG